MALPLAALKLWHGVRHLCKVSDKAYTDEEIAIRLSANGKVFTVDGYNVPSFYAEEVA